MGNIYSESVNDRDIRLELHDIIDKFIHDSEILFVQIKGIDSQSNSATFVLQKWINKNTGVITYNMSFLLKNKNLVKDITFFETRNVQKFVCFFIKPLKKTFRDIINEWVQKCLCEYKLTYDTSTVFNSFFEQKLQLIFDVKKKEKFENYLKR